MTPSYLALGGNVGPVARTFKSALRQIAALPGTSVHSVSKVFRFPAVGSLAGDEFCNAAARIDTALDPWDLLHQLQQIEDRHGRERGTVWGPRPLDLDIVFYGERIISHPLLRVPHPACWYRRFVLDPLAEIAADVMHPEKQATVGQLRARLLPRPLPVMLLGKHGSQHNDWWTALSQEFTEADISFSATVDRRRIDEAAILIWLGSTDRVPARRFESLPLLSRLDASQAENPLEFIRGVLHSALGS